MVCHWYTIWGKGWDRKELFVYVSQEKVQATRAAGIFGGLENKLQLESHAFQLEEVNIISPLGSFCTYKMNKYQERL